MSTDIESHKSQVVVAGHICLDIFPDLRSVPSGKFIELFQPGHMLQIGPPHFSTGGPVSNTGLALHILGIDVNLVGKIGRDMYGQAVLDTLTSHNPSLVSGMIIDPSTSTSYTLVISPPGIDRMFLHHPGANNTFCAEDIDFAALSGVSLFHFGYPPVMEMMFANEGRELAEIFRRVKKMDITTSLDMCFPDPASPGGQANWKKILQSTLKYVDVFTPSFDEILFMLRREMYNDLWDSSHGHIENEANTNILYEISSELLSFGVKIVLLKLGERGAYLRTASSEALDNSGRAKPENIGDWSDVELWAPCFEVNVAGTTGSGDATIAGFLCGLIRNQTAAQALTSAVAVGACNVEASDSLSGIQSWDATRARITNGWLRHELLLTDRDWRWDPTQHLWRKT